jgi:queuosine precursor transporter
MTFSRKQVLFIILAGFFITNVLIAEIIGVKLVSFGPLSLTLGIILWPVVFLTTDLMNEFYGKKAVRMVSVLTFFLILYMYLIYTLSIRSIAIEHSPVNDIAFNTVFKPVLNILLASNFAFLVAQFIDIFLFWTFRKLTNEKKIWLRATASTVISQFFDTFLVQGIAFYLPGTWSFQELLRFGGNAYLVKLGIAVLLIPFIYLGHFSVKRILRESGS